VSRITHPRELGHPSCPLLPVRFSLGNQERVCQDVMLASSAGASAEILRGNTVYEPFEHESAVHRLMEEIGSLIKATVHTSQQLLPLLPKTRELWRL
jgi:hypothetical protein